MALRGQRTIYAEPPILRVPTPVNYQVSTPLTQVVQETIPIIDKVTTIFPFTFFPTSLIIRINHIDIVRGNFFFSESHIRIQVPDIHQVIVSYVPFFGTLEVIPRGPLEHAEKITYLSPGHALRAKRIIAGLLECHQKKVNFSEYSVAELASAMEEIGRAGE